MTSIVPERTALSVFNELISLQVTALLLPIGYFFHSLVQICHSFAHTLPHLNIAPIECVCHSTSFYSINTINNRHVNAVALVCIQRSFQTMKPAFIEKNNQINEIKMSQTRCVVHTTDTKPIAQRTLKRFPKCIARLAVCVFIALLFAYSV